MLPAIVVLSIAWPLVGGVSFGFQQRPLYNNGIRSQTVTVIKAGHRLSEESA